MDNLAVGQANASRLFHKVQRLSKAEKVILEKLLEMKTFSEISSELHVAEKTVKFHSGNIYKKLEVENCQAGTASKRLLLLRMCLDFEQKEEVKLVLVKASPEPKIEETANPEPDFYLPHGEVG